MRRIKVRMPKPKVRRGSLVVLDRATYEDYRMRYWDYLMGEYDRIAAEEEARKRERFAMRLREVFPRLMGE